MSPALIRSFLRSVTIGLFALAAAPLAPAASQATERPNFVWLVSEDNSMHYLRHFFEGGAATPRIEDLAAEGITFDHAFSNGAVCSVARTTLITGCYAPRIGAQFHRRSELVPMPDGLRMFPAYLREAGYYTTNKNKKDYNAVEGEGVWDASSKKASWRDRTDDQPFFHFQTFGSTHESSLHFGRGVFENEKTGTDPSTVPVPPYLPDTAIARYTVARYHDRMQQVDAEIGAVVDQLETDGLLESTFIFYFGDHGGVLPRGKGYAYESGLHVPLVVRVPERFKHLSPSAAGTRVPGFVSFVDFGPTLLNLAGLPLPEAIDGRPFLGSGVTADELNARDTAFGYADRFDEKFDLVRTLRVGSFEYVRSYQPFNIDGLQNNYRYKMLAYSEWRDLYDAGKLDPVQAQFFEPRPAEALYHIAADPHETVDLSGDPDHQETLTELRERLSETVKALPDLSFFPESYFLEHGLGNPVGFGRSRQADIARLVDIADLQLVPFAEAEAGIRTALDSDDPLDRHWALVVCTAHGKAAARVFAGRARELASSDPDRLVRVRAAEFLGLTGAGNPVPAVTEALASTRDPVEALVILNSLVLLRDTLPGYEFNVASAKLDPAVQSDGQVQRRLEYLTGDE